MLADDVLRDRSAEIDRTEQYPWDNVAAMNDAGFVGMTLPKSHGGQGLGWLETSLVVEQIARTCAVSARIVVETNMGGVSSVMAYGSDDAEEDGRRHGAGGRQARDLHHRTGCRFCCDRDDHHRAACAGWLGS